MTLKSRLRVTQVLETELLDHTRLQNILVQLFDVEYYRDLEMWVRSHPRSLKLVPFESSGAVSYSPSIVQSINQSLFAQICNKMTIVVQSTL